MAERRSWSTSPPNGSPSTPKDIGNFIQSLANDFEAKNGGSPGTSPATPVGGGSGSGRSRPGKRFSQASTASNQSSVTSAADGGGGGGSSDDGEVAASGDTGGGGKTRRPGSPTNADQWEKIMSMDDPTDGAGITYSG